MNSGGYLLLNTGESIKLNSSDEQSIFDKYPLKKLTPEEKSTLAKKLENDDPVSLMCEYVSKITKLVEYFEKKY